MCKGVYSIGFNTILTTEYKDVHTYIFFGCKAPKFAHDGVLEVKLFHLEKKNVQCINNRSNRNHLNDVKATGTQERNNSTPK